jgi:hypothetical protein
MKGSTPDDTASGPNGQPLEPAMEEASPEAMQAQLREELDALIARVENDSDYHAPPYSPQALIKLLEENASRFQPEFLKSVLTTLRQNVNSDLLDVDTWKGIWYVVNYQLQAQADTVKRRARGEYETDEWGLDSEFISTVQPFLTFMYRRYWRVQTSGLDNVPSEGPALLTSNHSGQLPWDGAMVGTAVYLEHPQQRSSARSTLRGSLRCRSSPPPLPSWGRRCDGGERYAAAAGRASGGGLPRGLQGVGKLFRERYRLARFGRGGLRPHGAPHRRAHHPGIGRGRGRDLYLALQVARPSPG